MTKLPRLFEEGVFTKLVHPVSLSITENIVPLSTASMSLLRGDSLPPRSYVELFTPYGSAGMYRVRNPKDSYGDEQTTATLEHMISEVGDYVVKEEIKEMMEAAPAIDRIFHYYEGGLWALGNIEAIGFDEVAVDVDHDSVLDAMLDVLDQKPDCYMQFDFNQTPWKINIASKSTTVVAEGRLSRNVTAASISYDDTDLITRLWYKDYSDDDEGEWKFIDSETIADYGIVEGKVSTNASMTEDEMNNTISTYLYEHRHPKVTIEMQMAELSRITGERVDQFRIGDRVRLAIPDHQIDIDDNVIQVTWDDVIGNPNSVSIKLGDEDDTLVKYIHESDSSSGGGGGGGSSILDKLYYDFYSDDGYFHSRLEMNAYYLRTEFWEGYDYLYSRIEQTARYWQAEFVNAYAGLTGYVEITAEHWQSTFTNTYAGLVSRIEQTAGYWSSEIQNVYSGLSSRVEQTENHWSTTVQAIGSDGTIDAASICVAINEGGSSATINASKIYLLGTTIANTITADYINGKIATIPTLSGIAASFSGNVSGSGGLFGQVYVGSGTSYTNISDPILAVQISEPTNNTYKLQYKSVSNTSWTDAGSFSRATSLSGAWSGTTYTVTASPQGNTNSSSVYLAIEGTANPNATVYAKIYKDNPSSSSNQLTSTEMTLTEDVSNKKVTLVANTLTKGSISTQATYNSGRNSVTVTSVAIYGSPAATATSISVQGTASNGATKIDSISITAQRNNAYSSGQNSITDFGIWNGDTDVSGQTKSINPGGSITLKEWHKKDGSWVGGTTVTVSANGTKYYGPSGETTFTMYYMRNGSYVSAGSHNWYYL